MIRENIRAMQGYMPGEQLNDPDIIKLNTNENPYPPSPRVFEAIRSALTGDTLRKYPQPLGDAFRNAAGKVLGVDPDSILIGNGSDDILTILTRAFVPEGGLIASPTPSYILYKSLAEIQGAKFVKVPFTADWQLGEGWPRADLAFLPNPNSPSGTVVDVNSIAKLAETVNALVLDEAYADFQASGGREPPDSTASAGSGIRGLTPPARPDNVIITRTLSKSYSLAGIRFGFAIAALEVVRELVKVKDSYNCDVLSLAAATAAIQDQDYFQETRSKILASRTRMTAELAKLGFDVTPSQANFLWCRRTDRPLKSIYEALKQRKILVRYMNYDGYDGLRISVGTDAEIDKLLTELRAIL